MMLPISKCYIVKTLGVSSGLRCYS